MKKTITDYLTKRAIVAKLRAYADLAKSYQLGQAEITDEQIDDIQAQLLAVKLGFSMINFDTLADAWMLARAAKAKTPEELEGLAATAERLKKKMADVQPLFSTLANEFAGVVENKKGLDKVTQDLLKSAGVVLNQLGNAIEQSDKRDLSAAFIIERQIKAMKKKQESKPGMSTASTEGDMTVEEMNADIEKRIKEMESLEFPDRKKH